MNPYVFSLVLGLTGLVVMAFLGFGHHGGGHGGGHAHHGGDTHAGHVGHGGHHAGDGHGHHGDAAHGGGFTQLMALLSPRLLFSVAVGIGVTGLMARSLTPEPFTALIALVGGVLFEKLLVGPVWKLLFRFESRPARTIESAVMEDAQAMMDFDAAGQGLVGIELDGQIVQLLGTLIPEERSRRIRRGDLLRVEDVDAARNRCTVSYAGPRPPEALP